jgi:rhamnosyltransferase
MASCERVVLTVQDAIPLEAETLERLIAALDDFGVAGAYARQVPQPDADPITRRNLNAWLTGRMERQVRQARTPEELDAMAPMDRYFFCNFDNVCSVIRKTVWRANPFGRVAFGEDIDWAERVLRVGHAIVYEPAAVVVHSHDRPLSYEFKRTYVCHRKLYRQFGLHLVPSLRRACGAWFKLTTADIAYVLRSRSSLAAKCLIVCKLPALTALQILGQYLGAKNERKGRQDNVKGV